MKFRFGEGKICSFGAGLGLAIVTLGIYPYFWYFSVDNELQRIGKSYGTPSSPSPSPSTR